MAAVDTADTILKAARATVQARGYNALSFREIAKAVGVKSASIHYHFPTKGDLGAALAHRYTDDAKAAFDRLLDRSPDQATRLARYTALFRAALVDDNRMCLCGIMAAEHHDLPPEVRVEVDRFTDMNVDWLATVLASGRKTDDPTAIRRHALAIFAAIEGAQLVARSRRAISAFDETIEAYRIAGLFA